MIGDVTGILLAGGKSRRMGEDKRFLRIGEHTLFERTLAVLQSIFQTVCVVIAQDSPPLEAEVPVVRDLVADCGSLGGLYTGLKQAHTEYVFVVACDMPFLNPTLVRHVVSLKDKADIVMVRLERGLQPAHALYSRRCLPVIEEMLHARQLKIQHLATHPSLHIRLVAESELREIDHEGLSFININTPADLDAARMQSARGTDPASSA
ncbi:MAG: molybdenum cofactor guanylyltransferase [Nitrospira sp.]|nr:molybdenum cofactor guanylyltransferase [Nitrospira sp.]MBH0181423.1 molybdenum cofactor guanylyltransferase [Nitrospira sp.]